MQRDSFEPGPVHHEPAGGAPVASVAVEEGRAGAGGHSAGHREEWPADFHHWNALRARQSSDD